MAGDTIYPVYRALKVTDFDELYEQFKDHPSTHTLNDIDFSEADYVEKVSQTVLSQSREVDFISSCDCGHLVGNFYDGETCPKCNSVVINEMQYNGGEYPIRTWLRAPKEIECWMHPIPYIWLEKWTSYSGKATKDRTKIQAYIRDIIDPSKPLPDFMKDWVTQKMEETGMQRGFPFLKANFDRFIHSMLYEAPQNVARKAMTIDLLKALELYKDRLWCRQFPILYNSLHAIINSEGSVTNKRRYVDSTVRHVFQSASDLNLLEYKSDTGTISTRRFHAGVARVYQNMMSYYADIMNKHLSGKTGLPRKHLFGARHHLSARALISPIAGEHCLDEIHLSWECGVNLFKVPIIGRLIYEFNMTPKDAFAEHHAALQKYNERIDMLMKRFIAESPFRGAPVLVCRNPSVSYLSVQLMYLTVVKGDPSADRTMGISARALSGFNGDYDGDEMNIQLLPEVDSVQAFMNLHGSSNFIDRNKPSVTGHFGIMKLDCLALNGFLGTI